MSLLDAMQFESHRDPRDIWIALRTDGMKGSGTEMDPFNGNSDQDEERFDAVMRRLDQENLENAAIHIGPGVFKTHGTGGVVQGVGWSMRKGWKLIGSGIDVTVLKVVGVTDSTRLVSAIGVKAFNELVDHAEVSDLTVDCNMGENRGMAVGAVALIGSHTRVRRVRAVNFGTEAPPECFVLVVGGGHGALPEMVDCVIEDCVVEQPWENNTHETTCLQVSHGEDPTSGLAGHVRAGVLRDNYVNGEYLNGNLALVQSVEFRDGGGTFTNLGMLSTQSPHRHTVHKNLVLRGAGNATTSNPFNGVFPIEEIVSETVLKYRMPVVPTENPQGPMVIGKAVLSLNIKLTNIEQEGASGTYIVTTDTPHYRTDKNTVLIGNVFVNGSPANPFNAVHEVVTVLPPESGQLESVKFKVTLAAPVSGSRSYSQAFINPPFQALSAGGPGALVTGNRVIGCSVGGPYHDTYTGRDQIVRENIFHDVTVGPRQHLGRSSDPKVGSALALDVGNPPTHAVFTALEAHGLAVNDTVRISGAITRGVDGKPTLANAFNSGGSDFTVTEVPASPADANGDPLSFKYQLGGAAPSSNAWSAPLYELVIGGVGQGKKIGVSLIRKQGDLSLAVFSTLDPHGLTTGQTVRITGAVEIKSDGTATTDTLFNGDYELETASGNQFTYRMDEAPNSDAFSSPLFEKMVMGVSQGERIASTLIHEGTTARFTTVWPHGLMPGEAVLVDDALVKGSDQNPFNIAPPAVLAFRILSVLTPTSFTYEMTAVPAANAFGTPTFAGLWNANRIVIENNLFELAKDRQIGALFPTGIRMEDAGALHNDPYVILSAIIRHNVFRQVDGLLEPLPFAVDVISVEKSIIENNAIELARSDALRHYHSGTMHYFNNRNAAGEIVQGMERDASGAIVRKMPELARKIEDAMIMSLL